MKSNTTIPLPPELVACTEGWYWTPVTEAVAEHAGAYIYPSPNDGTWRLAVKDDYGWNAWPYPGMFHDPDHRTHKLLAPEDHKHLMNLLNLLSA